MLMSRKSVVPRDARDFDDRKRRGEEMTVVLAVPEHVDEDGCPESYPPARKGVIAAKSACIFSCELYMKFILRFCGNVLNLKSYLL